MSLFAVMTLGFYSIDIFARNHLLVSKRRTVLQNELSRALLSMSKWVVQGIGDVNNQPLWGSATGFTVNLYCRDGKTPDKYTDDTWITYSLGGNTLTASCGGSCAGPGGNACIPASEIFSKHVVAGVVNGAMPGNNPASGLYYLLSENNSVVEVGLVTRWLPGQAASAENPQVAMKVKLYARGTSVH